LSAPSVPGVPNPRLYSSGGLVLARRSGIIEILGPTATGKSRLALSSPGPISYLHSAETARGIIEQARARGTQVYEHDFGGGAAFRAVLEGKGAANISDAATQAFRGFRDAFIDGLGWARTMVVDTHPDLYLINRYAQFGAPKNAPSKTSQLEYGDLNAIWRGLLAIAHEQTERRDFLFILLCQTEDEWENYIDEKDMKQKRRITGRQTRVTHQASVPQKANVHIWTERAAFEPKFGFRIGKAWFNSHWLGWGEADNPMTADGRLTWGIPEIMGWITETPPEEWSR
jgi:hypothetical protein